MASISEIIARMQVIRLNVLPPYTYDDDEGQRSEDEYVVFYKQHIDDSIAALENYIQAIQGIIENRESERVFNEYLAARRRVIKTLPFCSDEIPDETASDYASIIHALRSNMSRCIFGQGDIDILQEYHSLLILLRERILLSS